MSMTARQKTLYYKPPKELADFMLRCEAAHYKEHVDTNEFGFHPKNTGIGKKDTSFYKGACHVRFDRKTLPKSGKRVVNGFFIEYKQTYYIVWDLATRALLCVIKDVYDEKLTEIKDKWEKHYEKYGTTVPN